MKPTHEQKERFSLLAKMGCCICGNSTAEIHHIRKSGEKRNHDKTIPLCHKHHRTGGKGIAVHAGRKSWELVYGEQTKHLEKANSNLRLLESLPGWSMITIWGTSLGQKLKQEKEKNYERK